MTAAEAIRRGLDSRIASFFRGGFHSLEIIKGLSLNDEIDAMGRVNYREQKEQALEWLFNFRIWITKADLTFQSLAAPERAEKCVRQFLCDVAPAAWALVGYERQERGAVHAHCVIDCEIDKFRAVKIWNKYAGWCRIDKIHNNNSAVAYVLKHAIKAGDYDIYGPGMADALFSTGSQLSFHT